MTHDRMNVAALGRILGTASGWDGTLGELIWFYDFIPLDSVAIPACACLNYNEGTGDFEIGDNNGDISQRLDIVETLRLIPKQKVPTS